MTFIDFEFALDIPQRELRTKNFIQFQAKYHDFYLILLYQNRMQITILAKVNYY